MLSHTRLLLPLRVPLPIRLRDLLQVLRFLRNPPRQVGFRLALLRHARVMTRLRQSRRPVRGKVSRQLVTPLPHGWLTSFTRSALILALSLTRRLRDAVLRPGSASTQHFRLYPRVAEVQEEVAARSEALARRAKPLSRVIPERARAYALADDAVFASSQPVNSAFAQLAGSRALGSRRWGSVTFSDMERLERLFQVQLEVTSSSLWLMSGILAMLKRDDFQPSDPTLFNSALSSVSAALSRQARTAAAGSGFLRARRRESLLAHTSLAVPETQKRSLTVTPGSSSGLFNAELLSEVVSQVQSSSQISSNLALSRSLRRGRSAPSSSSSPLTEPRLPSFSHGRPYGKRSSSSSRSGGRKRFKGGKGAAPSSGPSGFRR